jgi:hypothetical protein
MGFDKDACNNSGVPFYYYQGASIDQTKRNRKGDPAVYIYIVGTNISFLE